MSNILCVEKSKPSSLKRLRFLPRIGLVLDIGGREITYRQAPILEALYNLRGKGFSLKNLLEVSFLQLKEINLPEQKPIPFAGKRIAGKKKAAARKRAGK